VSECHDKKVAELLYAFELGLLSDEERALVEQHIIECDHCFADLQRTAEAARLLKLDAETRRQVRELTRPEVDTVQAVPSLARFWRVLAPVAVGAAVVLFLVLKDWKLEISTEEPAVAIENRVAILPFDDLRPSAENSNMGDVIANLLITDLSQTSSLQIVSSQHIYDLNRQISQSDDVSAAKTAETVAKRARARWLMDGAVNQVASEIVLTAQLIDVSTGTVKSASKVSISNDLGMFAAVDQLAAEMRIALIQPSIRDQEVYQPIVDMTTSSPEAYREYIRGVDLYRKVYTSESERHFRRAVELDSTFAMPYYYLSRILPDPEWRVCLDKARQYSDKAGERDRYFISSRVASVSGDWRRNMDILGEFVKRFKDEKEPLLQLGVAEYSYEMYPQAVKHLQMALALDSSNIQVWNQLAYTYSRIGDFENAVRSIDRCVALAPTEPNPYDSRAEIYALNGKLDQAIDFYRQALRLKPDFWPSLIGLGTTYAFKEDFVRSDSCFAALATSSNVSDRRSSAMYRAYLSAYQGHFREALTKIDAAIASDSAAGFDRNLPYRLFWKATLYEASGRIAEALSTMERSLALETSPEISDRNRKIAYYIRLLTSAGRTDEALKKAAWFKQALDSGQYHQLPYFLGMASIAEATKKPDLAVQYLEPLHDRIDLFFDRLALGKAYLNARRLAEATATLQKADGKYTPFRLFWGAESVKLHYYLGRAYEESQWPSQAADEYRHFLSIWKTADPGVIEMTDATRRLAALERRK